MKAPFPWFGGKSRVADLVWMRFGGVPNYVEPFFGSGAVLLERPSAPKTETVNDKDCFVANFWRALQSDPEAVARYADNPVNEADLHARHLWLIHQAEFIERMKTDPEFYDAKIAGWWVWGQSIWIGSGWCASLAANRVHRKRPHLRNGGTGVHRQLPFGGPSIECLPNNLTSGTQSRAHLLTYMQELANRMRTVRVCCGDWNRICGPSPTIKHGVTGVFLDPPYANESERANGLYAVDDGQVAHAVREWAVEQGTDPRMRIALCGYEGVHGMPNGWECVEWKALGGYGLQGDDSRGRANSSRERIWFSPHCLRATLFSHLVGTERPGSTTI